MDGGLFHVEPTSVINQVLAVESVAVLLILHACTAVVLGTKLLAYAVTFVRREYRTIRTTIRDISDDGDRHQNQKAPPADKSIDDEKSIDFPNRSA